MEMFALQVRRTVAPRYVWPPPGRSADPLYRWIADRWNPSPSADVMNHRRWPDPPWLAGRPDGLDDALNISRPRHRTGSVAQSACRPQ